MKNFIVNISKCKKWITLGLSILILILFCFPIMIVSNMDKTTNQIVDLNFPFILYLANFIVYLPIRIKNIANYSANNSFKPIVVDIFTANMICSILTLITFIVSIICIVRTFRGKKFYFTPALVLAFLTMLIKGISSARHYLNDVQEIRHSLSFLPLIFIFLILLILDVVYLVLERYYMRPDYDQRIAERKAERQAKQEAELKQSPEYRIEQLEKELQELKAKNNENGNQ